MHAFVVVFLAGCVCLAAANPYVRPSVHFFQNEPPSSFYKPAETLTVAKPHVAAFASIFQIDETVPLKEIPVEEEVATPLAIAIQPVFSSFHDEPSIFEVEHTDELPQLDLPNSALPNKEIPDELPVEYNENVIVIAQEDKIEKEEDIEHIPSPTDIPGFSYADTPEKMSALGIDTRFVDEGILQDSFLLVVSCGRSLGRW